MGRRSPKMKISFLVVIGMNVVISYSGKIMHWKIAQEIHEEN